MNKKNDDLICIECGNKFPYKRGRKLCSRSCYKTRRSKIYRGINHGQWKGGVSKKIWNKKCPVCRKEFVAIKKIRFCSIDCGRTTAIRYGEKNNKWKGGRFFDKDGYVLVRSHNHPFATKSGYVREHRLVMENHIHRFLLKDEEVHHINGIKDDNRFENLQLIGHKEHASLTGFNRIYKNKSGVRHIHYDKRDKYWITYARIDGKLKCIGYFKDLEKAKQAQSLALINKLYQN
jgi:hypothetical protein